MNSRLALACLLCISLFYIDCIHHPSESVIGEKEKAELAEQVRQEFLHSWNGYKKYAWGHDQLKPLSKSFRDWHEVSLYI